MGKSIEDCLEAKEWVDLFDAIDVNKKGSLNMKGPITESYLGRIPWIFHFREF